MKQNLFGDTCPNNDRWIIMASVRDHTDDY